VHNVAISANMTFSQQTFAESLKLQYPLLSDFPGRQVIRAYGVLNEKSMNALRSFFLVDPQGVVRRKWIIEHGGTTVVYSGPLLKEIDEIIGKR
jgi:peroxiredoxin